MKRNLLCALILLAAPTARGFLAAAPDWARPHLKAPVPRGGYIARSDTWIALYSEIVIAASPAGGLSRTYRQVLAPTGDKPRHLVLWLDYDEVTQTLVEPKVWIPGTVAGYKEIKLQKRAIDVPDLDSEMVTSGRGLLITTEEIDPGERAIVAWQVQDRHAYPGDALIFPFSRHPTAEFHVRSDTGPAGDRVRLTFIEPQPAGPARLREGSVDLRELPASRRIYSGGDPWLPSPQEVLPHVLLHAVARDESSWRSLAQETAALFQSSLAADSREVLKAQTGALIQGATTTFEKVAHLAGFVQSLTYRNVAWGEGAYKPEAPSETLRTMSADCKGKAVLLQVLLQEIGVASTPVVCNTSDGYLDTLPVPTVSAFNHVVLAIHLPEQDGLPAALLEGPGKGWILFDPTNPLSTLGRPPVNLEGSRALWVDRTQGDLFSVRTREPGGESTLVRLDMGIGGPEEAELDLTIEGSGDLLDALSAGKIYTEDREKFRARCQEVLQTAAPGIVVTEARFDPPDHLSGTGARLRVRGRIRAPLQPVGESTFSLPSPLALTGWCLGLPRHGYKKGQEPGEADRVMIRPEWKPERCCRGQRRHSRGEIQLTLPEGWSVVGQPRREISAPWMALRVEAGPPWAVTIDWPRGRFPSGSADRMLQDLNGAASLFQQSFLVAGPAVALSAGGS